MARPKKNQEEEDDGKIDVKTLTPEKHAKLFLNANADDHYNRAKTNKYKVSTGSLKLDIVTGGGVTNGVIRFAGENSGGKTSEGLELMRNFLLRPKARAMYVPAEGRLSDEHIARSGVKFVSNEDDWAEGTCLIFKSNIYEVVVAFIMSLIQNNNNGIEYFFFVDSVDGLILREDLEKSLNESYRVAGPAVISKKLMQRVSLPIHELGHFFAYTTQVTATVQKPGSKAPPPKISGPNALKHYCDDIWEFLPRWNEHRILKKPNVEYDPDTNPIIGHWANLIIRKSNNEKNDYRLTYPIKYGMNGGQSIWTEREVGDVLIAYDFFDIKGSWMTFKPDFLKEIRTIDEKIPEKVQGTDKLYDLLAKHKEVTRYCFDKFRKSLSQNKIWESDEDPFEEAEAEGPEENIEK